VSISVREPALPWNGTFKRRATTRRIIIHHAASVGDVDIETIHRWHLARGWMGAGYHYNVRMDGSIERGRPEWAQGAHARDNNTDTIGICLAGNIDQRPPPIAQMMGLVALLRDIWTRHQTALPLTGHSDVNNTACPGRHFPWQWLREQLTERPLPQIQRRIGVVWRGQHIGDGYLIDGVAHVPARVLAERYGGTVDWRDGTVTLQ